MLSLHGLAQIKVGLPVRGQQTMNILRRMKVIMMKHHFAAMVACSLFALSGQTIAEDAPRADAAKITPEAQAALDAAKKDTVEAQKKGTLWIPAKASMGAAEKAAEKGDSDAVTREAGKAAALNKLSMGQLAYPSVENFPK
jgi:hypothetical protein